jgi:hypothetical protein
VIDQNLTHGPGGAANEVGLRLPVKLPRPEEPQVSLVNESRGLQGVVDPFPAHVMARQPPQLLVNKLREALSGLLVPLVQRLEQSADFAW